MGMFDGSRSMLGFSGDDPYGIYTPQDEATALEMAKGAASSGLELFSDILDTFGGRAIKGLLGGKPRELLSVLPGSDYFNWTDETDRVTGKDLAKQWGLATDNPLLDSIAGLGVDLFTDPTTYMFGPASALTKGGQVAKAAGILPRTVRARQVGTLGGLLDQAGGPASRELLEMAGHMPTATRSRLDELSNFMGPLEPEQLAPIRASILPDSQLGKVTQAARGTGIDLESAISEPLGGTIGFGSPFSQTPYAVGGTGEFGQGLANALGTASDWLGMTLPARAARAMFNTDVEGRTAQSLQEGLLRVADRKRAAQEAGERYGIGLGRQLDELGQFDAAGQNNLAQLITDEAGIGGQMGQTVPRIAGNVRRDLASRMASEQAAGVGVGEIDQYLPRSKYQFEPTPGYEVGMGVPGSERGVSPFSPHLQARADLFREVPGTGEAVDRMFMDPRISSPFRTLARPGVRDLSQEANIIRNEFLGWNKAKTDEIGALQLRKSSQAPGSPHALTPAEDKRLLELEKEFKRGDEWAQLLSRADPQHAALSAAGPTGKAPLPFYDPDIVKGLAQRTTRSEQVKLRAEAVMYAVGKDAKFAIDAPMDWVPVDEVFQKIGMTGTGAEKSLLKMISEVGSATGVGMKDLRISRELYKDLTGYVTLFQRPTALDPFVKTWDTIQTLFKAGVTSVWPKKYMRDATQGAFQNFSSMSPAEFARYQPDAIKFIRHGDTISYANQVPGFERFSPELATKKLADEFASLNGFYTGKKSRFVEEIGGAGFTPKELPGKGREGLLDILTPDASRPTTWDPRDIAGIWGRETTKFAPVVAGGKISELIDETNKFALFLQRRMSGATTQSAWEDVLKRHYDFSNLSGFERSIMRRVVPFYSWMRQNVPATIKRLIDNPGGVEAMTAKALASQRSEEFIPEYVGEGLAIPVGETEKGMQRFLNKSGLPFEDAIRVLGNIGNIKSLGDLTPALKVPLEFATGTQLHTGRPLEDIPGTYLGPLGTLDPVSSNLLANSGFLGRLAQTGRPLLMPQKDERDFTADDLLKFGMGAVAPVGITDVDIEKQKRRAIRNVVEDQLRGSEGVGAATRFFVREEDRENLTPDQKRLLRVYEKQQDDARSKKKIGVKSRRESREPAGAYNQD